MRATLIDLTGQKFNKLIVISISHSDKRNKVYWNCVCDCGNTAVIRGDGIKSGHAKSCGCQKIKSASKVSFVDILGKRFGRLIVIEKTTKRGIGRNVYWRCQCDCGKTKIISGNSLRNGMTRSCGCLHREAVWKGGEGRKDYSDNWTVKLRGFVRNLDNHTCQFPGCTYTDMNGGRKLHVHHINGDKKNCKTTNLISLCNSHHTRIEHNNPSQWIDYFYSLTSG